MKELENLKELYVDEIKKINKKGELTPQDSEAAKKALEAMKMIDMLCEDEEEMSKGYSERYSMRSRMGGRYSSMMPEMYRYSETMSSYYSGAENDRSMARGRDSMGRYTSRRSRNYSGNEYSRHSTVSRMIEMLEDMMMEAPDERKRMAIQNCISELESY